MLYGKYEAQYRAKEQEIRQHYECSHVGLVENRRHLHADGRAHVAQQCVRCGKLIQYIRRAYTDEQIAAMPAYDETLRDRYTKERVDLLRRWRAHYESHQQRANGQQSVGYNDYLNSAEWQRKRHLVFNRAGGMCEGCGERPAEQVHHVSYENVGNEFLWELRAVCRQCHERVHGIARKAGA